MNENVAVNLNSPREIRRAGLTALSDALGPAGAIIFMQQFESGSGDYTKEKYDGPDISLDEISNQILALNG
ncbi:MAG: hypothetical protein LBN34_02715 [Clostridiales Family XIII bacterium]|jgi:hypothetical protein|nr:hypothetical protein [Clostridiales Family XIII bacterium]